MTHFLDLVVVTGAGRGLGKAVANKTALLGIPVLCISRTDNAIRTGEEIRALGGKADVMIMDIAELDSVQSRVAEWIASTPYRRLGVVLAAAVIGKPGGIANGDVQDWLATYKVNVLGNLAVLKGLLPRMLDAGFGRIVTLAGGGAAYAYPLLSGYALSKTAVVRAAENLHTELQDRGDFAVVCLAPGAMETDMLKQVRAAGAKVRTTVSIHEPVEFIRSFLLAPHCAFSGCFVHVRDEWRPKLEPGAEMDSHDLWLLRRIE
jgi:NAD(P)-dependent dehydrogenase (short-subunit alcohol dehydrogenase family)